MALAQKIPGMDRLTDIRDAATVIVVRHVKAGPAVLLGQRSATAAFMPSKYVFPGGAIDAEDAQVPLSSPLSSEDTRRLRHAATCAPKPFAVAAIRELWEETGLCLGITGTPPGWKGWPKGAGLNAAPLRFMFRAITPPGRSRRFDARFFMVNADDLACDLDDFSQAGSELSNLAWVPLSQIHAVDLPHVTTLALAELGAHLRGQQRPGVPFWDHRGTRVRVRYLA